MTVTHPAPAPVALSLPELRLLTLAAIGDAESVATIAAHPQVDSALRLYRELTEGALYGAIDAVQGALAVLSAFEPTYSDDARARCGAWYAAVFAGDATKQYLRACTLAARGRAFGKCAEEAPAAAQLVHINARIAAGATDEELIPLRAALIPLT